jgi:hypothetical protein
MRDRKLCGHDLSLGPLASTRWPYENQSH